jgi:hypothetical protein
MAPIPGSSTKRSVFSGPFSLNTELEDSRLQRADAKRMAELGRASRVTVSLSVLHGEEVVLAFDAFELV